MNKRRLAIVTGANRGLGLETSRQLAALEVDVILTARNIDKAQMAAESLRGLPGSIEAEALDVSSADSLHSFCDRMAKRSIDILVNNAGILIQGATFDEDAAKKIEETFRTNTLGPFILIQRLLPQMVERKYGRVVNVSSGMGQLSDNSGGYPSYRISKTALNQVTTLFAAEMGTAKNVLVNSVCPGWVRTDMGGPTAHRTVEKGAETIVWAATLPADGPNGSFLRDKAVIPW
jgi:NAD(P)-dependent dehydrogenase (short-subunit alcohol dehydrogenase family)